MNDDRTNDLRISVGDAHFSTTTVVVMCPHGVDRRFTRCLMCQPKTEVESVLLEGRPIRYRVTGSIRLVARHRYEVDLIAEPLEEKP